MLRFVPFCTAAFAIFLRILGFQSMFEIGLVLLAVVALGLVGPLAAMPAASLVTALGLGALAVGLGIGVPTGLWYHVALYRLVSRKVPVPADWWLSPARLHRHLTDAEHRRLRPWYRIGGVGFVLSAAGGLAAIAGLLMGR